MEAELMTLAASGATTMVGLMVSESWEQARDRLARLFRRDGAEDDEQAAGHELDLVQRELTTARDAGDSAAIVDIEEEWQLRLRRLLRSDPTLATELRSLLDELDPLVDREALGSVTNSVVGGVQHGPVLQGRDFSGLTFHVAPAPPAAPEDRERP